MPNSSLHYPPRRRSSLVPVPPVNPIDNLPLGADDKGPDVASYQGYPNWQVVLAAGYKFAFTKATESTNYLNPFYPLNWDGMSIFPVRGVYHFARPDVNADPAAEVDWFLSNLSITWDTDIPVLDLEVGNGNLSTWAIGFANYFFASTGVKVMLYSGGPFMKLHGLDTAACASAFSALWLAAYQIAVPSVPTNWGRILFWQDQDAAIVPGIVGACDVSLYKP